MGIGGYRFCVHAAARASRTARRSTVALFWAAWLLGSAPAVANGRYPSAQQLLVDPNDGNRFWLRATYGLLTSGDAGKSWSWLCEPAVGYSSGEDPSVAIGGDGTVLAGAVEGLFATTDHGCNWTTVAELGSYIIVDLASQSDATHVLALANVVKANGVYELSVWRSDDSGHHFARVGAPLDGDLYGRTLDAAPSDPSRLYVTARPMVDKGRTDGGAAPAPSDAGSTGPASVFLVSRDAGATWETHSIQGLSADEDPFIAAVHPTNPDVVYVRVRGPEVNSGFVKSRLLYTDTAGSSFREIFAAPADMLGFALTNGGDTALVGLGDTRDPLGLRPVDPNALGVYRASPPDFNFARGLLGQVGCIAATSAGLFVCGAHESEGFELGLSRDLGSTATRVLDFGRQITLLACGATSAVATQCTDIWPFVCPQIGVCPNQPDTGTGASGGGTTGGGCCGSGSSGTNQQPSTGTAHLDMLSESPEWLALAGVAAALARRSGRRAARRAGARPDD